MAEKVSETYQQKDPRSHVYEIPDTYAGSDQINTLETYIYDNDKNKMIKKNIQYVPVLLSIFNEIIMNSRDHSVRDTLMTYIKINIDKDTGSISILNDGAGIPIIKHTEHNIYIPEMIFGNLLTSSNYNKKEKRITGGKNGYGAKITNIFSKKFIVETVSVDIENPKKYMKYVQTWNNNMMNKENAVITKTKEKTYTKITFFPDWQRFDMTGFTDDLFDLYRTRVYDLCTVTNHRINVYFNDKLLNVKSFDKYIKLYIDDSKSIIYKEFNDRWRVGVVIGNFDNFEQISFVNGLMTYNGGTHVTYIVNQITKKCEELMKKKHKDLNIKQSYIKDHMFLFLDTIIENPSFSSQTKENLVSKTSQYGSSCEINDDFIKKIMKSELSRYVEMLAMAKTAMDQKKTDGKKKGRILNIPKLDDANLAGTTESNKCVLFIVEGDSAKAFVKSGIKESDRDYYGIFPLRGKFLNVRKENMISINKNAEINNLKAILGLQSGITYTNCNNLRYGKLMIATDQDDDGNHIKGLVMNWLNFFYPSLMKNTNFIISLITPIVKVTKGQETVEFYSQNDYYDWKEKKESEGLLKSWHIKYYKGLGTNTKAEARGLFDRINTNTMEYKYLNEIEGGVGESSDITSSESSEKSSSLDDLIEKTKKKKKKEKYTQSEEDRISMVKNYDTEASIDLAFNKEKADMRKLWIQNYDEEKQNVDYTKRNMSYGQFIHNELIKFSVADNKRSIPNICDGLKPSQRKILYTVLKNNIRKEIKVSQLAGIVSKESAYHHGETSLMNAIIGMAQNFVGKNNINYLMPNGQFGTRDAGGEDAASSRYIFTCINPIMEKIFMKDDFDLLNYLDDDGLEIEPDFYVPIIPMVLVNGSTGIGTGFSTSIPNHNPIDIINNLLLLLNGKNIKDINPFYRGFKGTIEKVDDYTFMTKGLYSEIKTNNIIVNELPVGYWTQRFKEDVEKYMVTEGKTKAIISNYLNYSTEDNVKFNITFSRNTDIDDYMKTLKLMTSLKTSNMYLFDDKRVISKFDNVKKIMEKFYEVRMRYYSHRYEYLKAVYMNTMNIMKYKVKFVKEVVNDKLRVFKRKKSDILSDLETRKYPKLANKIDIIEFKKNQGLPYDKNLLTEKEYGNYDYITRIPLFDLTAEKIAEYEEQYRKTKEIYDVLCSKTPKQIWIEDLNVLKEEYIKFDEKLKSEMIQCGTKAASSKRPKRSKK